MFPSIKRLLGSCVSRWIVALTLTTLMAANAASAAAGSPDPVLEWIGIMNDTVIAGGTSPLVTT